MCPVYRALGCPWVGLRYREAWTTTDPYFVQFCGSSGATAALTAGSNFARAHLCGGTPCSDFLLFPDNAFAFYPPSNTHTHEERELGVASRSSGAPSCGEAGLDRRFLC